MPVPQRLEMQLAIIFGGRNENGTKASVICFVLVHLLLHEFMNEHFSMQIQFIHA